VKTSKIASQSVRYYDSLEELPIWRFQKFNKFLLVDAGVGSDLASIDSKIAKIRAHLSAGRTKEADIELVNVRQAMLLVMSEVSPKHMAFSALVHSIGEKEYSSPSDSAMQEIFALLNTEKASALSALVDAMRKKFDAELKALFPVAFDSAKTNQQYDLLKRRVLAITKGITKLVSYSAELDALDDSILTVHKPEKFMGADNPETAYDKNFNDLCAFMLTQNIQAPKQMMTIDFYATFELIKKSAKPNAKKHGR
jgi:hypothetical protein